MEDSISKGRPLKLLRELHEYSFELAEKDHLDMFDFIVAKARCLFSVKLCWISSYYPDSSNLVLNSIALSSSELSIANNLLKKNVKGFVFKVTPDHYEKMIAEKISPPCSLKDLAMGSIPDTVCNIIQKTLGLSWFIGISLINNGKLFGNIFFAGHRGQAPLEEEELLVFRAITSIAMAKKETEKKLIKAKVEAESANRAKSSFLANMTHELRTPLCGIMGFTDLLETETKLDETQTDFVKMLKSSAKTLLELINDTLDLSKIEAGKLEIRPEKINVRDLFCEVFKTFEPLAKEKGLETSLTMPETLPETVIADPLRVKQVLMNLTGNAVKFTNQGFVRLKLEQDKINEKVFTFSIEDSGIGIEKEQLPKITESFYQADNSFNKKWNGTGLGLAITSKLLRKMGSQLEISSIPQKGSVFSFKVNFPKG